MNLLMAVNSAYVKHAKVTAYSLACHSQEHIRLYLLHSELEEKELKEFDVFLRKRCHGELIPVFLNGAWFEKLPIRGHFSKETYYRIYAQYLLPEEVDRILWLDADLVVKKSINDFYERDFKDRCLIACENIGDSKEESVKRLGLKRPVYFNAGVLLMNLDAMRRYADKQLLDNFINENVSLFLWQDQDILNKFYEDSILLESTQYNYQVASGEKCRENELGEAAVVHYVGGLKPWQYAYTGQADKYYLEYLKKVAPGRYYMLKIASRLYDILKREQGK